MSASIDPEVVASTPPRQLNEPQSREAEQLPDADDALPNSQGSTKENDAPTESTLPVSRDVSFQVNHAAQPADSMEVGEGALPPDLLSSFQYSTRVLEHDFTHSPPHTIQRLAELVLYPRKHYRFLPAYLRALDRTVSVTSPLSDFPLPTLNVAANGGFLTNGDGAQYDNTEKDTLGSDESLGGALLTPIPWLRQSVGSAGGNDGELHSESTETIEGPSGAGSIETVSVTVNGVPSISSVAQTSPLASPTLSEQSDASTGSSASIDSTEAGLRLQGAVTQGELLRQEQEAGVVPVSQHGPRRTLISGGAAAVGREPAVPSVEGDAVVADVAMEERQPEETPHARGPELIGMEDMGPQQHALGGGLDMEAAVGRVKSPPRAVQQQDEGVTTQPHVQDVPPAPAADEMMAAAQEDDSGAQGKDPADVEKELDKLREDMQEEMVEEAKESRGDVVIADADGEPAMDLDKEV